MLNHTLTQHAETRMRQRGMRDADLRLVLATATQVAPDAYLLTDADVRREINRLKREIERLERYRKTQVAPDAYLLTDADVRREINRLKREIERLERYRNWKIVVAGESVVTCYPSCPRDQRRTLRKGRARR